jgi:hypothetical protein
MLQIVLFAHKNLIYSFLLLKLYHFYLFHTGSVLFYQMARTYQTPRKSTDGRFPAGQLARRHQPEVEVEEDPKEVQSEVEV